VSVRLADPRRDARQWAKRADSSYSRGLNRPGKLDLDLSVQLDWQTRDFD